MKNVKEMTDEELVVHAEFMRRFSTWDIPVDKLDITLGSLSNEMRQMHYLELKDILEKTAFKREIQDWKRRVARVLAMGINNGRELTEIEREGLRILMIEIENFEEILKKRAELASSHRPIRAMSDKL